MPCLIADSGPLIALAKLGLLDLPVRFFGRVAIPAKVFAECQAQAWLGDAKAIRAAVDAGHLEVLTDIPRADCACAHPGGRGVNRVDG